MKVSFSPPLVSFVDNIENQGDELIIGDFNSSIKFNRVGILDYNWADKM